MKNNTGIYKITNIINNKVYIGSASFLNKRMDNHFKALKINKHFNKKLQSSYNKHGKINFKFEVIEYCSKIDLLIKEQYYFDTILYAQEFIKKEDNRFEILGYNIDPIAGSRIGCKVSDETKEKLRIIKFKQGKLPLRKFTSEQKEEYRKSFIKRHKDGKIPPRTYSDEQKLEKSNYVKEQYKNGRISPFKEDTYRKLGVLKRLKPVTQFSLENIEIAKFESATKAAKELNLSNKNISSCCLGIKKTHGKFKWKFTKDV